MKNLLKKQPDINNPREDIEQSNLIKWWRDSCQDKSFEKLLYAIPNGGLRSPRTAAILKRTGTVPGVPDLFLSIPCSYHGLYIEMKRKKGGVLSEDQKDMIISLRSMGYAAYACKGADIAKNLIISYLDNSVQCSDVTDNIYWEIKP